jgi:hypothetical protein
MRLEVKVAHGWISHSLIGNESSGTVTRSVPVIPSHVFRKSGDGGDSRTTYLLLGKNRTWCLEGTQQMSAKSEYIEQIANLPFTHNYES